MGRQILVFSSLIFLYIFLPASLILYFISPTMLVKNITLTVLSVLFYAWGEPVYVLLLLASAAVNYAAGMLLKHAKRPRPRRATLVLAVVLNLGALAFFKYAGFFVENFNALTGLAVPVPAVTLPIGISFYTFQALSYVVDVYRGRVEAQRSPLNFLLYLSLFPQLIAGPIVRYEEIAAQIGSRESTLEGIFYGATRLCIGLGKKVLLANYAGEVATKLLGGNLGQMTTVQGWLGLVMFAFQLYFDFSGYSDMAIGLGRIFGFRYAENFNYPYMAKSIRELWQRWHISLGSFFRDYVYIPMGGNRRHQLLNLFVVWGLTGLWHGASWNYVLWGLYFFVLLYLEKLMRPALERVPGVIRHIVTLFLILMGWAIFYFNDLHVLGTAYQVLFGAAGAGVFNTQTRMQLLNNLPLLVVGALACTSLPKYGAFLLEAVSTRAGKWGKGAYLVLVFLFDAAIFLVSTVSLVGSSFNPFLYFRF